MAKYVTKYFYLNSFNRTDDQLLVGSIAINDFLHKEIVKEIEQSNNKFNEFDETDDESIKEEDDSFSLYKQYKETVSENQLKNLADIDPKVYEGNIIDEESRKFVTKQFPDCQAIDLSKDHLTNEDAFEKTKKLLTNNDNIIIFQSVFITKNNKAITKPDAIVKRNGKVYIIETKGTTSTKFVHILDLFYQVNVIEDSMDIVLENYYLCIVKYELLPFGQVSFVLVDKCHDGKTPKSFDTYTKKDEYKILSLEAKCAKKAYAKEYLIWEDKDDGSNEVPSIKEMIQTTSGKSNFLSTICADIKQFWETIDRLHDLMQKPIPDVSKINYEPVQKYKMSYKDVDFWLLLRDYYYFSNNLDYLPFQFSGKLCKFEVACKIYNMIKGKNVPFQTVINLFETNKFTLANGKTWNKPTALKQYLFGISKSKNAPYFSEHAIEFIKSIRDKKVYFDFESLNLAIRVVDKYPPFMQTVNQVSVVIDRGKGLGYLEEIEPVVIDPVNGINKNDFKTIIDACLPSKNLEECKEYDYIVFNKNFETIRLREMAEYINEPEYNEKVKIINDNIVDIAESFIINKDNKYVVFKELKGFYSIKKVLPLVEKYANHIFKAAGCVNYKTGLDGIHNGTEAQNASTKRFFNKLSDEEWKINVKNLGKYCNNDVRAMIAIEHYLKSLIN